MPLIRTTARLSKKPPIPKSFIVFINGKEAIADFSQVKITDIKYTKGPVNKVINVNGEDIPIKGIKEMLEYHIEGKLNLCYGHKGIVDKVQIMYKKGEIIYLMKIAPVKMIEIDTLSILLNVGVVIVSEPALVLKKTKGINV